MKEAILQHLNPTGTLHLTDSQKKWQTKAEIKEALSAQKIEVEPSEFDKAIAELLEEGKIRKRLREEGRVGSPNEYTDTL
ncbi:MAG: hypothetical protein F9K23_17370 [Bacteroidetes bacterium]|nr:MAG: hypothetical protein F9K23_17370 [Bacteroidota bacterium]